MEFREYNNPESGDYDIRGELNIDNSNIRNNNRYYEQLLELIGILEDITEEELIANYGITMKEYLNPSEETIRKVFERLNSMGKHR